jgi:predicted RNase H-like HicB family nuclease
MSDTYRVRVTRDVDGSWLADVPDLQGAHTFARTLPRLEQYVREVIVLAAELPDAAMPDLNLVWEFDTGDPELDGALAAVREARRQAAETLERLERSTAAGATDLSARGYSVRDAAVLLGVSPARAGQLMAVRAAG